MPWTLHRTGEDFLNTDKVKPLLDLSHTEINMMQFKVAREFVRSQGSETTTLSELVRKHRQAFSAVPQVLTALNRH